MKTPRKSVRGQPAWRIVASEVEAFVTVTGGHLGPVIFDRTNRELSPLAIAPWTEEPSHASLAPVLRVLRGDFFCLPFGGNDKVFNGERHPLHGETANAAWQFESLDEEAGRAWLRLSLKTKARRGRVDKLISLCDGHNAVYCRHTVSGMSGPMCFGHHAMVKFPDRSGSGVVSTSPFVLGLVLPEPTERPERRGYSLLKPRAEFRSLESVPTILGDTADLTRYPARRGFEDLALVVADVDVPFAWTAVTFTRERYAWFALKDPRVLRSTLFWFSNGGRHYPPWSGRHVNVLGLEEVTSYFHYGLAESAHINPLSERGIPTSVRLDPGRPLVVNYILGATPLPAAFDRVAAIEVNKDGDGVQLKSANGKVQQVPLDLTFLSRQ
jgi:hypothetical protein